MNTCICCHTRLLRHLNRHRRYWFCPTCHQEMFNIADSNSIAIEPKPYQYLEYLTQTYYEMLG